MCRRISQGGEHQEKALLLVQLRRLGLSRAKPRLHSWFDDLVTPC